MTGAEILIKCLKERNVDTVFGYPGGTILNIYDALYRDGTIKHYLTAHEQGATHAADGYARCTGKPGVVFATSGPGATNMVTGLATAYMDSIPMVAVTCNVTRNLLGKDSFQEVDITGITMPITKHNYMVSDISELAETVREAFEIATSGRPGPVLIDIPKDVTAQTAEYKYVAPVEYTPSFNASATDFDKAAKLLNNCVKPFIMCGGGVVISGANAEIKELCDKLRAPVATTLMGIGGYDSYAEEYTGMIGMHGTKASNIGVNSCDVLLAVGCRFSDRVISDATKFAKNAKIIHIDIDPAEISKNVKTAVSLAGDAKLILTELNKRVAQKTSTAFRDEIVALKREFPHMPLGEDDPLNPEYMLGKLDSLTKGDAIIVTEVGQHQMWAGQFYKFTKPRTFITSGGLGTMGFGTGASMGCAAANTGKQVVSIAGDGSFRMNCNELSTIGYYNLPIIILIMNNGTLGMVRQWQTLFYGQRYSQTTLDRGPDFKKLAEAYFIDGYTVKTKAEYDSAMTAALKAKKPCIIDAHIAIDQCVFPMVGPGQPIQNIITSR